MRNEKRRIWLFVAYLVLMLAASAGADPLRVVASTTDLAAIAREIGGENILVESLCRADQDPHEFELLPSQASVVQKADVYLKVGLALDVWADRLLANAPHVVLVNCSQGIAVIGGDQGKDSPHPLGNPHYWLGPSNWSQIAANVRDGLTQADSAHAADYQARFEVFVTRVNSAMQAWREKFAVCNGVGFVSTHASWDYFARDFGLTFIGVVHRVPDVEPSPADFARLEADIRRSQRVIFLEEPFVPARIPEVLKRDTGLNVVAVPSSTGNGQNIWSFGDELVRDVTAACVDFH